MSGGSARLKLPGFIIAVCLGLAGCAAPHGPRTAQETTTPVVDTSSALALSAVPPDDLIGLDSPSLQRLLGEPGMVRRDYPAEVWQYRNPSCVLDVYLYPDNNRLTVTHAEARAPKLAGDPIRPCIAKLAELKSKTTG